MSDVAISPPEEQRLVLRLLGYWRDQAADRPMPSVDDIDGAAIPDMWQHCFVLDRKEEPQDFRVRYAGEWHRADLGLDPAGRSVAALDAHTLLGRATAYCSQVAERQVPITIGGQFVDRRGRSILYRSILLPLDGDGSVAALLGAANCRVLSAD